MRTPFIEMWNAILDLIQAGRDGIEHQIGFESFKTTVNACQLIVSLCALSCDCAKCHIIFSERPNVSSFSHIFFLSRSDIISSLSSVLLRHLPLSLHCYKIIHQILKSNKVFIFIFSHTYVCTDVYIFEHIGSLF